MFRGDCPRATGHNRDRTTPIFLFLRNPLAYRPRDRYTPPNLHRPQPIGTGRDHARYFNDSRGRKRIAVNDGTRPPRAPIKSVNVNPAATVLPSTTSFNALRSGAVSAGSAQRYTGTRITRAPRLARPSINSLLVTPYSWTAMLFPLTVPCSSMAARSSFHVLGSLPR